ncbi:hypothetical protein LG409_12965 [Halomonas sp. NyZ770]|uniref:hypothetical protein n=1 Tax=Halomonas sp. NyZ770 TaxID=2883106 RepID=UPI001D09C023|nr:hypothetical protein [Halomonas sp. NyZ770]UDM06288.1 hypothetical protein LG409_12965 [Halomonas sp. NyZ770]
MLPRNLKQRISSRDWSKLKKEWRAAFVDYENIGASPESTIKDIAQMNKSVLTSTSPSIPVQFRAASLRATALREAIFLSHKAGALLRSFNRDLENRETTYPEITAYTAAYFLSKSISLLLGLWMDSRKINGDYWLFDMAGNGSTKASAYKFSCPTVGHVHIWDLCKKSLDGLTASPVDGEFLSFCGGLAAEDFARLRNSLQYNSREWIYKDLHASDAADISWLTEFDKSIYTNADPNDDACHFGVTIFLMLFRANFSLISDIAKGIDTLEAEVNKMAENIPQCNRVMKLQTWVE